MQLRSGPCTVHREPAVNCLLCPQIEQRPRALAGLAAVVTLAPWHPVSSMHLMSQVQRCCPQGSAGDAGAPPASVAGHRINGTDLGSGRNDLVRGPACLCVSDAAARTALLSTLAYDGCPSELLPAAGQH